LSVEEEVGIEISDLELMEREQICVKFYKQDHMSPFSQEFVLFEVEEFPQIISQRKA